MPSATSAVGCAISASCSRGSNAAPVGRDLRQALAAQHVAQSARGQRHAAAQRLLDARLRERVERALEVVEHGQERAQDARAGLRRLLLGEPRLALLVVVEVGREPAQMVEVLVALALEIGDAVELGLGLDSGSRAGRGRRRMPAPATRASSGCLGSAVMRYDRAWSPSSTISASSMTSSSASASSEGGVPPPSAEPPVAPVFWYTTSASL